MTERATFIGIMDALDALREERTFRYVTDAILPPGQILAIQDPVVTDGKRVHVIPSERAGEILGAVAELGYEAVAYP